MYQQYRPSSFSILPTVVKNLLIINGLCFLANVVLADRGWFDMNEHFGLYYPGSEFFKPYQIITHVFMHGSFTHLFFNMFSLWMFGNVLENYWGPKRFFIFYFTTALGAALLHTGVSAYHITGIQHQVQDFLTHPDIQHFNSVLSIEKGIENSSQIQEFLAAWQAAPNDPECIQNAKEFAVHLQESYMNVPVVGASGAVFGLLLGFGMLFPNSELFVMFIPFPIKAKYFVIIYGLIELFQGVLPSQNDNVAHYAHLGGMLFGFILIKYWNKKRRDTFY